MDLLEALTYAGNKSNLEKALKRPNVAFVQANILDTDLVAQLLREHEVDTIVHSAAESRVDRSIHGPDIFSETNVQGTYSLLKAFKEVWLCSQAWPAYQENGFSFYHISTKASSYEDPAKIKDLWFAVNPKCAVCAQRTLYACKWGIRF